MAATRQLLCRVGEKNVPRECRRTLANRSPLGVHSGECVLRGRSRVRLRVRRSAASGKHVRQKPTASEKSGSRSSVATPRLRGLRGAMARECRSAKTRSSESRASSEEVRKNIVFGV